MPEVTAAQMKEVRKKPGRQKEEVLFAWESNDRLFKKKTRQHFKTVASLAFLASLVLVFLQEFAFILVLWAGVFLYYVFGTVPPLKNHHKITDQGLVFGRHAYLWNEMDSFWFENKNQALLLHFNLLRFPWRLTLFAPQEGQERLREILSPYLPFREVVSSTFPERLYDWLLERFF